METSILIIIVMQGENLIDANIIIMYSITLFNWLDKAHQ